VLREMEEEAGVRCDRSTLRFVASQPWLFPRSLMVGYTVEAADDSLSVDPAELEDAQWFDKEYVRAELARQGNSDSPALPGGFHVPSRISLARTIIESWLEEQ
jgi:NAD+ diphosphatase